MTQARRMRPAATLKDTIRMIFGQADAVVVTLKHGLQITRIPGQSFAIARPDVAPSDTETRVVCEAATAIGVRLAPINAQPVKAGRWIGRLWQLPAAPTPASD